MKAGRIVLVKSGNHSGRSKFLLDCLVKLGYEVVIKDIADMKMGGVSMDKVILDEVK